MYEHAERNRSQQHASYSATSTDDYQSVGSNGSHSFSNFASIHHVTHSRISVHTQDQFPTRITQYIPEVSKNTSHGQCPWLIDESILTFLYHTELPNPEIVLEKWNSLGKRMISRRWGRSVSFQTMLDYVHGLLFLQLVLCSFVTVYLCPLILWLLRQCRKLDRLILDQIVDWRLRRIDQHTDSRGILRTHLSLQFSALGPHHHLHGPELERKH